MSKMLDSLYKLRSMAPSVTGIWGERNISALHCLWFSKFQQVSLFNWWPRFLAVTVRGWHLLPSLTNFLGCSVWFINCLLWLETCLMRVMNVNETVKLQICNLKKHEILQNAKKNWGVIILCWFVTTSTPFHTCSQGYSSYTNID